MTHANCTCPECERLDALPVRRHGIPHAKQTTFIGASYDPRPIDWPEVEPYAPQGPSWKPSAQTCDDFPLFRGGLEPSLF